MTTEAIAPPSTKSQVLRSFDVNDFPALNGLEEEWRFTPLKRLRDLVKATALTGAAPSVEYGDLPAGVTVSSVSAVDPILTPFDRISALAYGSASSITLIEVAAEAEPAEAAVIRVVGKGGDAAAARTVVTVGAFAKATIVLEQVGTVTLADNIEVVVADSAQLTFVTLADWDRDAVQAQHVKVKVGKDARVQHVQVTLGGDLVRQFTSVEYAGRGGDAELWGLYFADSGQHQEHRQLVDHSVPDCRSYVGYRGALQGASAHTVWVGDVLIRAEATGTDTYEINRNLVLTDGARADSVPNLEIETGEVAGAGHASATGRFDDEQLFYLMARGIPEGEARKLVVRGFFAELINKIPVEELRERLGDTIEARLAEAGQ
ncbi:Fe-S cluster assembly protein SufD [Actinoplanes sp. NBRC 101535]|uniref:Fe-S cluster assembly protein SufD n=1 Tax=Actinoplanes sp. NBRC 101535 TaxID=3032196 RepID=UPI0024A091EA|nr:Fe-S cluster assembly protein SufD [Actinoplanes sp. NBRC 101535]GLY02025.1 Fe-S cluster assembly protein SufD [Actinoplanes sp. NBRC 101535]